MLALSAECVAAVLGYKYAGSVSVVQLLLPAQLGSLGYRPSLVSRGAAKNAICSGSLSG